MISETCSAISSCMRAPVGADTISVPSWNPTSELSSRHALPLRASMRGDFGDVKFRHDIMAELVGEDMPLKRTAFAAKDDAVETHGKE